MMKHNLFIIILLLSSIQLIAGCVDKHENTGIEIQNKIIRVANNNLLEDLDLYSFNSILYGNYPERIIIQAPKNINGWSVMTPEVVNIMYEKEIYKNIGLEDLNSLDIKDVYTEDNTFPIPTKIDPYAENDANSNPDPEDYGNPFDE